MLVFVFERLHGFKVNPFHTRTLFVLRYLRLREQWGDNNMGGGHQKPLMLMGMFSSHSWMYLVLHSKLQPWWPLASFSKASVIWQTVSARKKEKCVLLSIQPTLSHPKIFDPVQKLWGKRKPWDEYDDIMVQKREGRHRWSLHVFKERTVFELCPPKSNDLADRTICNKILLLLSLLKLRLQHRKQGQKLWDSSW